MVDVNDAPFNSFNSLWHCRNQLQYQLCPPNLMTTNFNGRLLSLIGGPICHCIVMREIYDKWFQKLYNCHISWFIVYCTSYYNQCLLQLPLVFATLYILTAQWKSDRLLSYLVETTCQVCQFAWSLTVQTKYISVQPIIHADLMKPVALLWHHTFVSTLADVCIQCRLRIT